MIYQDRQNQKNAVVMARWLKVAEAADYARVTRERIRSWIAEGLILPAVTRNKRDLLGRGASGYIIDVRDLDTLLERMKRDVSEINPEGERPTEVRKEVVRTRRNGRRASDRTDP